MRYMNYTQYLKDGYSIGQLDWKSYAHYNNESIGLLSNLLIKNKYIIFMLKIGKDNYRYFDTEQEARDHAMLRSISIVKPRKTNLSNSRNSIHAWEE